MLYPSNANCMKAVVMLWKQYMPCESSTCCMNNKCCMKAIHVAWKQYMQLIWKQYMLYESNTCCMNAIYAAWNQIYCVWKQYMQIIWKQYTLWKQHKLYENNIPVAMKALNFLAKMTQTIKYIFWKCIYCQKCFKSVLMTCVKQYVRILVAETIAEIFMSAFSKMRCLNRMCIKWLSLYQ
jgi:hypothetical protein